MVLQEEWKALKARIDAFGQTANLAMQAYGHYAQDTVGILPLLKAEAANINQGLENFIEKFPTEMSFQVRTCIEAHLASVKPSTIHNPNSAQFVVFALAGPYLVLGAEVTQLLADTDQVILFKSERAFLHLRRSIEASPSIRSEWKAAFEVGEVACEKLGSVHLLLHGIYAFKINAAGARTDLVLNEPVDLNEAGRVAEGLVLTEWKRIGTQAEVTSTSDSARKQCEFYNPAVAGIELRSYRYIVLVSEHALEVPPDITTGGLSYRHINVAVDPKTPSAAAR